MTIDMHVHYLPAALAEALRARDTAPCIETDADGTERRLLPAGNRLPYKPQEDTDMDARLAFMDEMGVARQVLSLGLLSGLHCLPAKEAAPLARAFNDDLAALIGRHPDRFSGIALLPVADMDAAVAEFGRARSLGLIGAIVPANGFATLDDAEKLRPLFAAAQQRGGHMFVHPGLRPDQFPPKPQTGGKPRFSDNALQRLALEVQANLGHATVTLVCTDFLDPYPDVTVQVANLGGTLPMVIERMDHAARIRTPDARLPSERLGRVHVDCASLGPSAIEAACAAFGTDKVLFGTDCPIFRTDWTIDAVAAANISTADRNALLSGNAEALLMP